LLGVELADHLRDLPPALLAPLAEQATAQRASRARPELTQPLHERRPRVLRGRQHAAAPLRDDALALKDGVEDGLRIPARDPRGARHDSEHMAFSGCR
jgi:hypothetical protein